MAHELPQAGSALTVRHLFLHRLSGALELRQRVRPNGAAPFLHRLRGVLELRQRVRPDGAESFSLSLSGRFAAAAAGACRAPRRGKKEGQPAVFLPL